MEVAYFVALGASRAGLQSVELFVVALGASRAGLLFDFSDAQVVVGQAAAGAGVFRLWLRCELFVCWSAVERVRFLPYPQ